MYLYNSVNGFLPAAGGGLEAPAGASAADVDALVPVRKVASRRRIFFAVTLLLALALGTGALFAADIIGSRPPAATQPDLTEEMWQQLDCKVPGWTEVRPARGMFAANQQAAMQALLAKLGNDPQQLRRSLLYMRAGDTEEWYYSDTEREFRQEANFFYVSGYPLAGAEVVLAAEVNAQGRLASSAYLFVDEPDENYGVWHGIPYTLEELRAKYDFAGNIFWRHNMTTIVQGLGRSAVHILAGTDLSRSAAGAYLAGLEVSERLALDAVANARAIKTAAEMELIALTTNISAEAHKSVMLYGSSYRYEYQVAGLFQQLTASCGATKQAYQPISPSGRRTAVLHYVTNEERVNRAGHGGGNDMILVDAGSESYHYVTDITRTWPANGRFTAEQRKIYDVVLRAQNVGLAGMVPGGSFSRAAQEANVALLEGLLALGIVRGRLADLLANNIHKVFQPHGLGHLVGLTVHDAGILPEMLNPPRNLEPGMVLTVEPGLYFIPHLLEATLRHPVRSTFIDRPTLERYTAAATALGGVRIEDMVEITTTGFRLLSASLPRTADDIELFIAEEGTFDCDAAAARLQDEVQELRAAGWRTTRDDVDLASISLQQRPH